MFYAHSKKGSSKENWQSLKEHLENTAKISSDFASKFDARELGFLVGLIHDIGKYSQEFQRRLQGSKIPVDHSTAALKELMNNYPNFKSIVKVLGFIVSGHHSGLPNGGSVNLAGTLNYRMKQEYLLDYSAYKKEINIPKITEVKLPKLNEEPYFTVYFFIKMLFSCLVDADFLDTEHFMEKEKNLLRKNLSKLEDLDKKLDDYLNNLLLEQKDTEINRYRKSILETCKKKALTKPGFFTLTVPTGGGKTLSSMAFAMKHGIKNRMDRIIYVIPYTSIIEQNADKYREIFGEENILEHHCNFIIGDENENYTDIAEKLKLAAENWDIPIVVTTNVQFFESIFSNKSSKSRKLHNLSRSVIILDEAQMLPVKFLKLSLMALYELVRNYKSTVVFCTATQPSIKESNLMPKDIDIQEIIDEPKSLYEKFKRTKIINLGEIDDNTLVEKLKEFSQVLCIVNRKEHAKRLYEYIQGSEQNYVFHLSTYMYPAHRRTVIKEIKERLKNKEKCIVISTQLIEAGVDIDFPVVFRALAGIDSIAQAAGRCNREGERGLSDVYVFKSTEKYGNPPKELLLNVSMGESVFRNIEDPMSLEGIKKYFTLLYDIKNIDHKNLLKLIKEYSESLDYPFLDIAKEYKLIEDNTITIIVPREESCKEYLSLLKSSFSKRDVIRMLQPYMVNVYEYDLKKLLESGGVEYISELKNYVLTDTNHFYDENLGIVIDVDEKLTKSFLNI
ncbi:CRISPR-associated endonuclease/helicase Cas3 [Anaerobranca californiensis DSM 14826]|jgi:CRISPR-associated helicase Cas3/CRISPR-associated endonuclease Cas3-HD|uniref:CRISPR-associated endonuclease/helicase Cas3 n=1 Tax=Anaerobranca californiensis DSM 14826 TaxID=1120989 RepID=A0A1M6MKR8_9FIRM|nr:CRISPR-associated helicase/endonuclease Cas3 [Anaerobranca californiensis]SHJ84052.1 CRISPR-associated endonuclease/helicase Cas3 [Anaerobranca californiensis DSM 14826]